MNFSQKIKLNDLETIIIKLPSPFPQVNEINTYLFPDDRTMIDAGVRTRESRKILFTEMAKWGLPKTEVKRIYLTHGHPDHAGNIAHIQRHSGAKIYLHEHEKIRVARSTIERAKKYRDFYLNFLRKIGIPDDMIAMLIQINEGAEAVMSFPDESTLHTLEEGETFKLGDYDVHVLHVPGHTPGMLNFYIPSLGVLFSGDHILPTITPNPILELKENGETHRSLVSYLKSLERIANLEPLHLIFPGHGDVITDPKKTITSLINFYRRRTEFIYRVLKKFERARPVDLLPEIFPNIKKTDYFLAISEIIGNLELLEEMNLVKREENSEHIFYSIVKHR